MTDLDQADYDYLRASALAGKALGLSHFAHLDQPIGVWNYIRIANDIASRIPRGKLLDWGCGYGQMTYLLLRRGYEVTPFDVGSPDTPLPDIPVCRQLNPVRTLERTELPFDSESFDVVLSCGVLEHVDEGGEQGDEVKSLDELARVMRPGGSFLIYQLPQRFAWQESIIRRFNLGYAHPRRYTESEITKLLLRTRLQVVRVRRANLIPKNLTGMPPGLRAAYSRIGRPLITIDGLICHIPILNEVAGVLEITARR